MNTMVEASVLFAVKKVKDFAFFVDENLFVPEIGKILQVQFQHNTEFNYEKNLMHLTFRTLYLYQNSSPTNVLLDIHILNTFEIPQLKEFLNSNSEYILPENLIISIVSITISHARALLAKNAAGTVYQDNILPIINPVEVAKSFYPQMFVQSISKIENMKGHKPIGKKRVKSKN